MNRVFKKISLLLFFLFIFAAASAGSVEAANKGAPKFYSPGSTNYTAPTVYTNLGGIDPTKSSSATRIQKLFEKIDSSEISQEAVDFSSGGGAVSYDGTAGLSGLETSEANIGGINIKSISKNTAGLSSSGGAYKAPRQKGVPIDSAGGVNFFTGIKSENLAVYSSRAGVTKSYASPMLGGDAGADGKLYLGRKGIEIEGNASVRAGAWADAGISHQFKAAGENIGDIGFAGGIGAGLAAGVGAGIALRTDKVGLSVKVAIGPVRGKLSVNINPEGIWRAVSKQFKKPESGNAPSARIKE